MIAHDRNTGLWPVRPARILLAVLQTAWQRSKTPLGAQTWKSVFLMTWLRRASTLQQGIATLP